MKESGEAKAAAAEPFDEAKSQELLNKLAEEKKVLNKRLEQLSNRFYTTIPQGGYSSHAIRAITTQQTCQQYQSLMTLLCELQIALRIVIGAQLRASTINPYDYTYHALQVQLRPLARRSEEFKLLRSYTHASIPASQYHIYNIFQLRRKGEEERFHAAGCDTMSNRALLWHGSSVVNFAGILSQGLRIAPPEADSTGFMFGKVPRSLSIILLSFPIFTSLHTHAQYSALTRSQSVC